jgi:hypothetical protein
MFATALRVSKIVAKFQILKFCPEQIDVAQTLSHGGAIANEPLYYRPPTRQHILEFFCSDISLKRILVTNYVSLTHLIQN